MKRQTTTSSPCTSVCQLDSRSGFCLGCWRTGQEIAGWSRDSESEKLAVLAALNQRREQAGGRPRRQTRRRS